MDISLAEFLKLYIAKRKLPDSWASMYINYFLKNNESLLITRGTDANFY